MSEFMNNDKYFHCKERGNDFVRVGKNDKYNGVGIIVEEHEDASEVVLSWENAVALRDHLNNLINLKMPKAEFGTYAAHQPNYESFARDGKLDDYAYQSIVHLETARHHLSWALTVLDYLAELPNDVVQGIKAMQSQFDPLVESLRDLSKGDR